MRQYNIPSLHNARINKKSLIKKTRRQVDIGMNVNKNKSECNIKVTCLSFKTFQKNYHFTNQNVFEIKSNFRRNTFYLINVFGEGEQKFLCFLFFAKHFFFVFKTFFLSKLQFAKLHFPGKNLANTH